MKRSYSAVIGLSVVLLLNIICTQYAVNTYYYEKYEQTIMFAILNVLLFPIAVYIYKKGVKTP